MKVRRFIRLSVPVVAALSIVMYLLWKSYIFAPNSRTATKFTIDERRIRTLIASDEGIHDHELKEAGGFEVEALPIYASIIDNQSSDSFAVAQSMIVVVTIPGNRDQFVEKAILRLQDSNSYVRSTAVHLLGAIGRDSDATPIAILLYDRDSNVSIPAARAIAKIGGKRGLSALSTWLALTTPQFYGPSQQGEYARTREAIQKVYDDLWYRLEYGKSRP